MKEVFVGCLALVSAGERGPSDWFRVVEIDGDEIRGVNCEGNPCLFLKENVLMVREGLTKRDYENALASQAASNGVALVISLADVVQRILAEMYFLDKDQVWALQHPVFQLMLHQINTLATAPSEVPPIMDPARYSFLVTQCQLAVKNWDASHSSTSSNKPA